MLCELGLFMTLHRLSNTHHHHPLRMPKYLPSWTIALRRNKGVGDQMVRSKRGGETQAEQLLRIMRESIMKCREANPLASKTDDGGEACTVCKVFILRTDGSHQRLF
ncbi:hypothetical protein DMENIID0001_078820 [Sergentomyia squamirostris]